MISAFIVISSLVLAGLFLVAYAASPSFRDRIERPKHLEFLFSGLVRCTYGRTLSGYTVRKKGGRQYTYYKCTRQNRGRCGTKPASGQIQP